MVREKPVDELLDELSGAAKQTFLEHKAKYIELLLSNYHLDPAEIGYDPEHVDDFLREHCSGLVWSECLDEIEKLIKESGGRKKVEEWAEEIGQSIEDMARQMTQIDYYCKSWGLDSETCDTLKKIERNPCLDTQLAEKVLTQFFRNTEEVGWEEAVKIVKEYIERQLRKLKCLKWTDILNVAKRTYDKERKTEKRIGRALKISTAETIDKFLSELERKPKALVEKKPIAVTVGVEKVEEKVEKAPPAPTPAPPTPTPIPEAPIIEELRRRGIDAMEITIDRTYDEFFRQMLISIENTYIASRKPYRKVAANCIPINLIIRIILVRFKDSVFKIENILGKDHLCFESAIAYGRLTDFRETQIYYIPL